MDNVIGFEPAEPRPVGAWSEAERCQIDRLKRAIDETARVDWAEGASECGDPWIVALQPGSGELALHIARIGRDYVVLDGGLASLATGPSLRRVIEACLVLASRRPRIFARSDHADGAPPAAIATEAPEPAAQGPMGRTVVPLAG